MKRHLFAAAFVLGALTVLWVGVGYIATNPLALIMTALIAAVYGMGARELHLFRQATATLSDALARLASTPDNLDDWIGSLHPSLRNPVRLRIEGERTGLPGPALTPYLVGLLVMLGMLGTFLGMVVTLNGAVFALEGTTDLQAIRAALAEPIKGLGLAFGTSVAGVAASAMLGLMSALSRRERLQAAQTLDTQIATTLRAFSLVHQRLETFKALQAQAQALPDVVDKLQAMMAQMERQSQQLNERLLANQESFHGNVKTVYTELADAVGQSLKDSLAAAAQAAGESLRPVVETAMAGIAQEAERQHTRVGASVQQQLDGLAARFAATTASVADTWTNALANHTRTSDSLSTRLEQTLDAFATTFEQRSAALLTATEAALGTAQANLAAGDRERLAAWTQAMEASVREITAHAQTNASATLGEVTQLLQSAEDLTRSRLAAEAEWTQEHSARMEQLAELWRNELGALRDEEAQRGNAAVARLDELQAAVAAHLTTLGTALEAPLTRLIETASVAPRAAAEVIEQLRQEMSQGMARDNALLEERSRIMATLNALLDAINHASAEQRATIDALVDSAATLLDRVGGQFAAQVDTESVKLADIAAHVTSSAVEVASLGETLNFAVRLFNESNDKLIDSLQRIEGALDKSMTRSDEQLAYYVAQAREIIDLSIMSQKEVFDDLRQRANPPAQLVAEVN